MDSFSELVCDTAFAYSPRGDSTVAKQSRQFCHALKRGDEKAIGRAIGKIGAIARERKVLDSDSVLLPMPGHAPRRRNESDLWVGELLVEGLVGQGLGRRTSIRLVRECRVPKSAYALPGQRPTHQHHYDSLGVAAGVSDVPGRITVVDDVLTRGATMLGAAARLREAFPDAEIRGFAFIRTTADLGTETILNPKPCRISLGRFGVRREP